MSPQDSNIGGSNKGGVVDSDSEQEQDLVVQKRTNVKRMIGVVDNGIPIRSRRAKIFNSFTEADYQPYNREYSDDLQFGSSNNF